MTLDGILAIAASGVDATSRALAVVGQNVANAGTAGYIRELPVQSSVAGRGLGAGVQSGPAQRQVDTALQAASLKQGSVVAYWQAQQSALSGIDWVQGATGSGHDLASLTGKLRDSLTTLADDPANQGQQNAVLTAAGSLSSQIRTVAAAVATARQNAQDDAVSAVATLNGTLVQIGHLSDQIVQARARDGDTADLENQRDAAVKNLAGLIPVSVQPRASGDITLIGAGGLQLPTHDETTFSLAAATLGDGAASASAVPRLMLGSQDVTASVQGGRLGADLALRDQTLPRYQAGLDEFAHTLASRFDAQGLTLFTDGAGVFPAGGGTPVQSGYLGFSSQVSVNSVAQATPSVLRDGLVGNVAQVSSGLAGDATLLNRITDFAFGAEQSAGVAQPAPSTTGLGANGTLALPYAPPKTLQDFAVAIAASQAGDAGDAQTRLGDEIAIQGTVDAKYGMSTGVSIDTEMSAMVQLQHAYAANGKVMSTLQSMWDTLLAAVH